MERGIRDALETVGTFVRFRYGSTHRTRAALEAWQETKVRKHLETVVARSAFYRERFAHVNGKIARWRELPVLDKAAMMENFSRLNTAGVDRDQALALALRADQTRDFVPKLADLTVGLSSGTSGNRGLFLASQSENNQWSGVALAKMLPGSLLGVHRLALLHRANSHLYQGLGALRLQFRYFDLLQPAQTLCAQMEDYQPTVLIAPPCALRLLADALREGQWRLKTPRRVISVAEVLEPVDRRVIEAAFQCRVDIAYVATEGFVASTCARGGLHLNEDLLVVEKEWLDASRRTFVPILTDFRRLVVPVIRYRLDDVLTLSDVPCVCGSVHATLQAVQGRCDDVFRIDSVPVMPDFLRRAVMQTSPEILSYELVQTGRVEVRALLVLSERGMQQVEPIAAELERQLSSVMASVGAPAVAVRVTIERARACPLPERKVRRVRREWSEHPVQSHVVF